MDMRLVQLWSARAKHPMIRRISSSTLPRRGTYLATPGKFEVKRLGALRHRNDRMAVPCDGYSTSNFTGSANSGNAAGVDERRPK